MKISIPLASEPYWNYYDKLGAMISQILKLADGGQLITQGTDIMSPALAEQARATVAEFERFGVAFESITGQLKQNLNLATEAFARKSA
jgi:hypothetical protein